MEKKERKGEIFPEDCGSNLSEDPCGGSLGEV